MKMPMPIIETIDRETTKEELFRPAEDGAMYRSVQNSASPATASHSMDYQWYEVPPEEFISLMAVCASSPQN